MHRLLLILVGLLIPLQAVGLPKAELSKRHILQYQYAVGQLDPMGGRYIQP